MHSEEFFFYFFLILKSWESRSGRPRCSSDQNPGETSQLWIEHWALEHLSTEHAGSVLGQFAIEHFVLAASKLIDYDPGGLQRPQDKARIEIKVEWQGRHSQEGARRFEEKNFKSWKIFSALERRGSDISVTLTVELTESPLVNLESVPSPFSS